MALDTTERRIDFVMTDQAVSHMRKHRWADFIRSVKSAMAGQACIRGLQFDPRHIRRFSEICSGIDRLSNRGANSRQLHMKRVVELGDSKYARSFDRFRIVVATCANSSVR